MLQETEDADVHRRGAVVAPHNKLTLICRLHTAQLGTVQSANSRTALLHMPALQSTLASTRNRRHLTWSLPTSGD